MKDYITIFTVNLEGNKKASLEIVGCHSSQPTQLHNGQVLLDGVLIVYYNTHTLNY